MRELIVLTDANLESILNGGKPVLMLISNGEGVRGEFSTAFKKAADEQSDVVFATLDPSRYPQAAARFDAGSKPIMLGWYGAEIVRRPRPWGSDVPLAIDLLKASAPPPPLPIQAELTGALDAVTPNTPAENIDLKPVNVTDATFEAEVLNYDKPVLVDFWAEWCGPCRTVGPILHKLAGEFGDQIRVAKVDVDSNPGLQNAFQVMSIPTIMLIKERTIVFSQPGALPEAAFRDLIKQLIALKLPPREAQPAN